MGRQSKNVMNHHHSISPRWLHRRRRDEQRNVSENIKQAKIVNRLWKSPYQPQSLPNNSNQSSIFGSLLRSPCWGARMVSLLLMTKGEVMISDPSWVRIILFTIQSSFVFYIVSLSVESPLPEGAASCIHKQIGNKAQNSRHNKLRSRNDWKIIKQIKSSRETSFLRLIIVIVFLPKHDLNVSHAAHKLRCQPFIVLLRCCWRYIPTSMEGDGFVVWLIVFASLFIDDEMPEIDTEHHLAWIESPFIRINFLWHH